MDSSSDSQESTTVLLCAGCASEIDGRLRGEPHPLDGGAEAACAHCAGGLAGFAYAVPKTAVTGMVPGAG